MENKKQDKIDKILQKVEQKSSKIYNEDNDPVIAAANLLQTEEYMKGLKDPSFSSVFNTQMKLQDIEAKKDLYKAAKLQEEFSTEPYDDRYVDLTTGEIKRISENKNYNMKLQTYDLASNFKSFLSGFAGDAIQGVGLGLDTAYNGLIGGLASVGEIGQYIFNGEEKNAETRKQLEKDLADNFDRISLFTDITNTLATPFNEYERDKNFVNIHQDLDYLGESFDKGNVKEFAKELVNTGLHTVPTMVEGLLSYGAAVPALAKLNKENQAKELGVNPNEILDTTNKASLAELAGATVYGLGGKLSLASMKGAVGRGLIGQSGKASSGFIDSVATPTRSVFDKLKPNTLGEDIPGLNAALKAGYYGTLGTGKAVKNLAKYGSGVGLVALGEGLSEGVQTAGEKIATGDFQNKSFEENYKDLEESMLLGAIAGGGLGAVGKAVTAPISYVTNKAKEREIFETTKQNAAKLSKTLNVKDMFSSSIKETTDSKGNSRKTTEVENPLTKLPKEEVELRDNIFHNLSQVSLEKYDSNPDYNSEGSPLNINKNTPLLNEVFSLGASGFLNNIIQKDGTEIPSQMIIDKSIGRAIQAVNEHIDSIIKTNPNTDTDGVMSTLAEFKEKMKNNPALDYYVARQMLTNPDQVKQLLARAIGETSDNSTQNESEGEKLSSYENMTNAAIKQGQEAAVKEYTQEQLNNLKKASKFISELTGIEELASNVDQKLNENKDPNAIPENTASSAVSRMLNRINNIITALETPEEKREDFRTNATLNTALGAILTGHTTSTGQEKKSLTEMLQGALKIVNKEGKQGVQKSEKVVEDIKSLKWWLNSHRAKYKLYKKVTSDLKEAEKGGIGKKEAIYMIPKEITPNGLGEVVKIEDRKVIAKYLEENFKLGDSELDNELSAIISGLKKETNTNLNGTMENLRNNLNDRGLGYHIFTTMPHTKSSTPEKTLKNIEGEGIAITETLDLLEGLSFTEEKINSIIKEVNGAVNPADSDNSKDNTSKEDTQTTTQPDQETAQEVKQEDSTNGDNNNEDIPPFDPDSKSSNSINNTPVNDIIKNTDLNNENSLRQAFQKLREIYTGKTQGEKVEKMCNALGEYQIGRNFLQALLTTKVVHGNSERSVKAIENTLKKYENQKNSQPPQKLDDTSTKNPPTAKSEINNNGNTESENFPDYSENFGEKLGEKGDHLIIGVANGPKADSYGPRTYRNIEYSDVTIAFANNFETGGERLTTKIANGEGKYLRPGSGRDTQDVKMSNLGALNNPKETAKEIAEFFKEKYPNKNTFTLNIAGNGMRSLSGITTQQKLNSKMRDVLKELINELPGIKIKVRSGGQTGMDLAGVVAAYSLGLDTTMYMPSRYMIRPKKGKDIRSNLEIEETNYGDIKFNSKEDFIKYIRMNNMHKLDDSSTNNFTSANGDKSTINQTPQKEYSPVVQKILEETRRETPAQREFKKKELQELDVRGEGVDMEGEEDLNLSIPETLDEAQQQIKKDAEELISYTANERNKKITNIEDGKQRKKAISEVLPLSKILKAKGNPRSQLGLSVYDNPKNQSVINFYSDINDALKDVFGMKNWNDGTFGILISFFGNIGTSDFISSKKKGTSNVSPLFLKNRARMSGIFRALDALVDFRFNNQEWKTLKEKYPNLKDKWQVPKDDQEYFTRGISLSLLARDIGKKILSDVGLTMNEENATLGNESAIHQELGMIAIEALSRIKLVETKPVTLSNIYNDMENSEATEVRVRLNLNNIFKNDGNVTKAMQFIDHLSREFNLDNSNEVNTYSTTPFTTEKLVKTKKGVFAMPDKMYEAINAFLNTPFVVEHSDKVKNFIAQNEKALKTFLGYKDVSRFIKDRDLIEGVTPTILYNNTGIKYSDIDSVLGKNLQVEEDIRHLKELLVAKNSEGELIAEKGIYFNKTFSAGRLWTQSSTVNPQSKKLHRFLVNPQTQTREEKLKDEKLSDSTYAAIAQAFGYKTDKKFGDEKNEKPEAINVGKAIVNTDGLKDKVIEALGKKGEIKLAKGTPLDKDTVLDKDIHLEIEEIGHALNALFNIEAFKKALDDAHEKNEKLESFTHNIIAEVDGINNGIALKGLTFMASPKIFNPLLSTGISFHGELKDKTITQLFDAPASIKDKDNPGKKIANPDKAYDTYELFAIKTSESFRKFYKAINKKYTIDEEKKAAELENKDEKDISPEDKEFLDEYRINFGIDRSIGELSKKLVKRSENKDGKEYKGITKNDTDLNKFTPKVKNVVNKFSEALTTMNNLIFVDGTNESIIESVPKEARSTNKFIVIPAGYGSGVTSNARSLTTYVMDNLKDWMLEYVDTAYKDEATKQEFQNTSRYKIVDAIFEALELSKVTLNYTHYDSKENKNYNPKNGKKDRASIVFSEGIGKGESWENHFKNIRNLIINSKENIGDTTVVDLSRHSNEGRVESLYEFVDRYMAEITKGAVKKSRDELLPGYEPINNSINSIHNSFAVILNAKYNEKAYEILKEKGIEMEEEGGIPTELLTIKEHTNIMKELKKDFPSITVDSKIRFGENKEKKHVGRLSTVNMQSKSSPTKGAVYIPGTGNSNEGSKTLTISYERLEFGYSGATPVANMTQQNDGSDMTDLSLEGRNEQGQIQQNDIFDAVTLNPAEYIDGEPTIISKYNENQVNRGLNSSQLYDQTFLAAKAARIFDKVDESFLSLSDLVTKGFNPNSLRLFGSVKEALQFYYNNLAATMHSYYTISEVNKTIVRQLEIVASNMQNGEESDKAFIEPKRINLTKLIENKGYDVKEYVSDKLMIDITSKEISSKISWIEHYLNLIYDNKVSNNTKEIDEDIEIETIVAEVEGLRSIIEGKIESIKKNLKNDLKISTFANDLTKYIRPFNEGLFSLKAQIEEESGKDVDEDIEGVDKDKIDREAKNEEINYEEIESKKEENTKPKDKPSSSNSPTKNNEIKESTKTDTNTAKESEPNAEYQGDMEVIERLANALEQLLKPRSIKDQSIEQVNLGKAKENIPARIEKAKGKLNEILRVGFNKDIDLRKLGENKDRFSKLQTAFKAKLNLINIEEYLKDPRTYIENLFKDIVGKDSIFDKINKEVLKSFENVDDTKVGDTSMDEFVSQIDLTTDKVSTTQEQMRSIDEANGRAMSKEFSNHLKGVLSELSSLASEAVNGVKVKYFKSKGKGHNEGEFLTNLREILIKEGIPLSKGNFTGTASLEETYGHELLHAITYYVIKAQAGGNPLTRELSMLHKRYLSVMTPSKLAKYINSGIPSKDLEIANRIIGHFENNTIEGLSEFIAIALSNEAVWNSLKDIEVKSDPNYDGMTFGERVVAKAMKMFNTFFNSIYRKYQDNDNMQKAMIALATKIATANSKAEYKIDKEMAYNTLETADTLTTVANALSTGLDKVDEVTSEKLNKLKDYMKSKGVKLVSVPKSRRRKYNSRWEEIRGLVAILASDVVGDKAAQAALSVAHDIGLHYNGVTQYVVSELSQMSEVKRKAEYLSRQRDLLDANREREININTEVLEKYFNTPLTLAENQALGEGMLDTDLSSLLDHYSIDELPDILNNIESYKEKAYSDMLKEVDNNFKDRVGKYSKDDYKRYITNQANSLAYFMNYQSYRNEVEGAIGVKNPTMIAMAVGTGANLKPNKKVVSAIDKYVTLAALEYLESDVKDLIVDKLRTEPEGMRAMMNYHRTNKAESLEKNFGGNPALMMKGYRYDVVEDYIDIKIAPVSEESLLKSQGFRRVSKEPLRKSPDDNSEERAIYINDFIPSTASFNQQAVSYLGHTGRGSKLSDIYNDKILKGADVHTVEQEWYDSIVDLTKNSSLAARKLMSPNYSPANYKDKKGSENIMIPIFDEHGDLRDFAYLMSKKTKKDLLGLDTSLTKSLSHMSARTTDKYEAQKLNERVADELYKDYAEANFAERQYHFVEMSFESKDPYIREIYKMLEPSFKNYLEEKFGGKIMVRASTMLNFFGQRDMDYRNTANYREKDVPYKKVLLASLDVARQVAKLAKMEIVLRFGSTIYNNFVSNGITLLIRGVPITSIAKDQIEGGRLLNKYLKDTKELKKLEAKKKAGGDVRDVEIENLKRELERNPIRDMMEFGLFSTIQTFEDINLDDKDNSWTARQVRKYTVENENIPENVREWMQKGYDWAFVTDRTVIGKNLTKLVQMGDFVARYALYKHYMRDNKMDKKEALEKVSDEFINYDLPVNKAVKFANDYGFLFFTRYYLVSQKVMAMLASDRPVSAGLVVGLQALFNRDFADIFDGNVLTKNAGELVSDPFTNLYRTLSPTGYDLVKGAYSRI